MKTILNILDILWIWLSWPFTENNPDYQDPEEPEYDWTSFLK